MKLIDGYALAERLLSDAITDDQRRQANMIAKVIEEMPSAQPEQRWIPCSERLPEKPNMYTVTDSKGDVVRFIFTGTESSKEYWRRCAKAWMPLPEPYK